MQKCKKYVSTLLIRNLHRKQEPPFYIQRCVVFLGLYVIPSFDTILYFVSLYCSCCIVFLCQHVILFQLFRVKLIARSSKRFIINYSRTCDYTRLLINPPITKNRKQKSSSTWIFILSGLPCAWPKTHANFVYTLLHDGGPTILHSPRLEFFEK